MTRTNTTLLRRFGMTAAAALFAFAGGSLALSQQYGDDMEWEPDEGYHEQEWYDPSDWFDIENGVDYEDIYDYDYYNDSYDNNDYGDDNDNYYDYNDDYDYNNDYYDYYDYQDRGTSDRSTQGDNYDYGWHRERDDSWDYGWHYDQVGNYDGIDYDYDYYNPHDVERNSRQDQRLTGQVTALERVSGGSGEPDIIRVRFKTQDGRSRTLQLGDVGYASQKLPDIRKGDEVVIGGHKVTSNGREYFKARELRSADSRYEIPEYEYQRRIEGDLVALRKVKMRGSDVEAMVAEVRCDDGKRMNVLLGSASDLGDRSQVIRPGTRIRVDGYSRDVDGRSTFIVQDVSMRRSADSRQGNRQQHIDRDRQRQQQMDRDRQRQQQMDRERQHRQQMDREHQRQQQDEQRAENRGR